MPRELSKCRAWEKQKRDRLKEAFTALAKVLPCYDPSKNLPKIEVLQKAKCTIVELQGEVADKATSKDTAQANTVRKFQVRIKRLLARNEQLSNLLRDAGISIPKYDGGATNFKKSKPWSNRITPEQSKIFQKKEMEKENRTKSRRNLKLENSHRKTQIQPALVKKVNSTCLVMLPQTKCMNGFVRPPTAITNFPIKVQKTQGVPKILNPNTLSALGPGTLILGNNTAIPVVTQPQIILPPTITYLTNTLPTVGLPVNSQTHTTIVNPVITVNQQQKVNFQNSKETKPVRQGYVPIRVNYSVTNTTQVNKVPIPAWTTNYTSTQLLLQKGSKGQATESERKKCLKRKVMCSSSKGTKKMKGDGGNIKETGNKNGSSSPKCVKEKHIEKNSEVTEKTVGSDVSNVSVLVTSNVVVRTADSVKKNQLLDKQHSDESNKVVPITEAAGKENTELKKQSLDALDNLTEVGTSSTDRDKPEADSFNVPERTETNEILGDKGINVSDVPTSKINDLGKHYISNHGKEENPITVEAGNLHSSEDKNSVVDGSKDESLFPQEENKESSKVDEISVPSAYVCSILKEKPSDLENSTFISMDETSKAPTDSKGNLVALEDSPKVSVEQQSENLDPTKANISVEDREEALTMKFIPSSDEASKQETTTFIDKQPRLDQNSDEVDIRYVPPTITPQEGKGDQIHSELSNDIFSSLNMGPGCQNPESTSPTAAFLLAFPLVSSVKANEATDEENLESHDADNLLQNTALETSKSALSENLTNNLLALDSFSFFTNLNKGTENVDGNSVYTQVKSPSIQTCLSGPGNSDAAKKNEPYQVLELEKSVRNVDRNSAVEKNYQTTDAKKGTTDLSFSLEGNVDLNSKERSAVSYDIFLPTNVSSESSMKNVNMDKKPVVPQTAYNAVISSYDPVKQTVSSYPLDSANLKPKDPGTHPFNNSEVVGQNKTLDTTLNFSLPLTNSTSNIFDQNIRQFCTEKRGNETETNANARASLLQNKPAPNPASFDYVTSSLPKPVMKTSETVKGVQTKNTYHSTSVDESFNIYQNSAFTLKNPNTNMNTSDSFLFQNTQALPKSTGYKSTGFGMLPTTISVNFSSGGFGDKNTTPVSTFPEIRSCSFGHTPTQNINTDNLHCGNIFDDKVTKNIPNSVYYTGKSTEIGQMELFTNYQQSTDTKAVHNQTIDSSSYSDKKSGSNLYNFGGTDAQSLCEKKHNTPFSYDKNLSKTTNIFAQNTHDKKQKDSYVLSGNVYKKPIVNQNASVLENVPKGDGDMFALQLNTAVTSQSHKDANAASQLYMISLPSSSYYEEIKTCSYTSVSKSYSGPLYTSCTNYNYDFSTDTGFNQNYYRPPAKFDISAPFSNEKPVDSIFSVDTSKACGNTVKKTSSKNKAANYNAPINWMTTTDNKIDCFLPQLPTQPYTPICTEVLHNPEFKKNALFEDKQSWSSSKFPHIFEPPTNFVPSTMSTLSFPPTLIDQKPKDKKKPTNEIQGNFFSVSQLVDHNKSEPAKVATRRNSGNRSKPQSKTKRADKCGQSKQDTNYNVNADFCYEQKTSANKNRNSSSYSAEALIGKQGLEFSNKKSSIPTTKPVVTSNFLADSILTYFPPVEESYSHSHNFTSSSFAHNSFQNTTHTTNSFINSTPVSSMLPNNFDASQFFTENVNEDMKQKSSKVVSKDTSKVPGYSGSKKVKKRQSNENNTFDCTFNSGNDIPVLHDEFSHSNFLPHGTSYPCKNLGPKQRNDFVHNSSLLPLPGLPRNTLQAEPLPSLNAVSVGTSLTNFNLSTIFPEINKVSFNPEAKYGFSS